MKNAKLGELYNITSGGTPSKNRIDYYEGGNIPWIRTGDLKKKYITQATEFITELGLKNSSAKYFPKGTVLIAMYGATIGECSILSIEATTNQACAAFIPIPEILPEYLYYYFLYNKEKIINLGIGGAQPNISIKLLKELEINVLDIHLQSKIVQVLDKAQSLIDKRKEQIKQCDELIQSLFYDMFGDPVTNSKRFDVKYLGTLINNIRYGTSKPPRFSTNGYKFIRATNIKKGYIIEEDMKYISEEEAEKIPRCLLKENDIIIVRSGVNAGETAIVTHEYSGQYAGYDIIVELNESIINPLYLNILLNTNYMDKIIKPLTRRAAQPHLNAEQIKTLSIILPPLELQNQFSEKVQKIEHQKQLLQQSLTLLEDNFNSLMQKAFKGELFQ